MDTIEEESAVEAVLKASHSVVVAQDHVSESYKSCKMSNLECALDNLKKIRNKDNPGARLRNSLVDLVEAADHGTRCKHANEIIDMLSSNLI